MLGRAPRCGKKKKKRNKIKSQKRANTVPGTLGKVYPPVPTAKAPRWLCGASFLVLVLVEAVVMSSWLLFQVVT